MRIKDLIEQLRACLKNKNCTKRMFYFPSSWQRKVTGKNELLMLEEPDGSSFFVVLS